MWIHMNKKKIHVEGLSLKKVIENKKENIFFFIIITCKYMSYMHDHINNAGSTFQNKSTHKPLYVY